MSSSGPPKYPIGALQRMREEIDRAAAEATKDEDVTTDIEDKEKKEGQEGQRCEEDQKYQEGVKEEEGEEKKARSTSS